MSLISPDTSRFVEDLRRDLQTDLRQATASQNANVNLDVRVDTTAAKAALAAFRAEQERNPVRLRIDVDENQLRRLREAFGGTADGAGNSRGFEQLTAQVDRLAAALSQATSSAGNFGQVGETAGRRLSTALSDTQPDSEPGELKVGRPHDPDQGSSDLPEGSPGRADQAV